MRFGLRTLGVIAIYLAALLLMARFAPDAFWSGYFGNLMATLAGVALGIPAGLAINRQAEAQRREAERRAQSEGLRQLLSQVLASVQRVTDSLRAIMGDVAGQHVVPRRLDHPTWAALAPAVLPELARFGQLGLNTSSQLAYFYSETEVVQLLLDQQLSVAYSGVKMVGAGLNPVDALGHGIGHRVSDLLEQAAFVVELVERVREQAAEADPAPPS